MMISELCTDGNMRESLNKLKWEIPIGIRYLRDVVAGMAYLHSFRVLHGDLKSVNVLVDRGVAKIADFGLARVRNHVSNTTSVGTGDIKGTPLYMAPEVWDGEKLMAPADVYAFAILMFEVTDEGNFPWAGLNQRQVRSAFTSERSVFKLTPFPLESFQTT
jgi:serine/threonine-protein kinase ULK/ATG1